MASNEAEGGPEGTHLVPGPHQEGVRGLGDGDLQGSLREVGEVNASQDQGYPSQQWKSHQILKCWFLAPILGQNGQNVL